MLVTVCLSLNLPRKPPLTYMLNNDKHTCIHERVFDNLNFALSCASKGCKTEQYIANYSIPIRDFKTI